MGSSNREQVENMERFLIIYLNALLSQHSAIIFPLKKSRKLQIFSSKTFKFHKYLNLIRFGEYKEINHSEEKHKTPKKKKNRASKDVKASKILLLQQEYILPEISSTQFIIEGRFFNLKL